MIAALNNIGKVWVSKLIVLALAFAVVVIDFYSQLLSMAFDAAIAGVWVWFIWRVLDTPETK